MNNETTTAGAVILGVALGLVVGPSLTSLLLAGYTVSKISKIVRKNYEN